jgi:acetylornithine deacetylase/succinyl-diaminopimelate desuccinylase-like protein
MIERAVAYLADHDADILETLKTFARIPSNSADPDAGPELRRSAEAVRDAMAKAGLEHCEVLELTGAHPYVYGDWLHAPGKPTLLLYAHHDVQPPGRPGHWKSPPFEPTERDGRLYGRGVVDDKAGIVVHLAAIEAFMKTAGKLPCNVKLIVEGEEEIGSGNLPAFLAAHKDRLRADVIVLTDTANIDAGVPSLTYRLRGLVNVGVEIVGLAAPLHSGMWGGPVPDPVQAMVKILATLTDERGNIAVPEILADVRPPGAKERSQLAALPFDEAKFRADAGMVQTAELAGSPEHSVYERQWLVPSLTLIALEASPIKGSSNQIVPSARARVSIRLVPDMDPDKVAAALADHLRKVTPWGLEVTVTAEHGAPGWVCTPEGPAFEAAKRALTKGFGQEATYIGCGGTIPFVGPFAEAFGGAPALLVGLEDPICKAHSENESLNLDDFKKALKSAVYLYEELAKLS